MKIADAPYPGSAVKPPSPAPAQPPERKATTPAPSGRTAGDGLEAPRAAQLFAPPTPPAPYRPGGLSPSELATAQQTIALASDGGNAEPVVDWLRDHPDPSARDQFFDLMFDFGPVAGQILNSTQRLGLRPEDKALLAEALNHAYESGAVTADEVRAAVERTGYGAPPGDNHVGLAEVVGLTGNPDLIAVYAAREIQILQASPVEAWRAQAVATALGFMPAGSLQSFLASNLEGVKAAIGLINADPEAPTSPALGNLLNAATRIQPPTGEALAVFEASITQLGENAESLHQAAVFFIRNFDAIVDFYRLDNPGLLSRHGQNVLSAFLARTLFNASYEDKVLGNSLAGHLASLTQSLEPYMNDASPPLSAQQDAALLGSLVGTIERGFLVAVRDLERHNEAVEKAVDLAFTIAGLLPAGKGIEMGLELIQGLGADEWITKLLQKTPEDAATALPFHDLVVPQVPAGLAENYNPSRTEVHTNDGLFSPTAADDSSSSQ